MVLLLTVHDFIYCYLLQLGMKRSSSDGTMSSSNGVKRQKSQPQVADPSWPLDKQHADAIINFLIRLACQVCDYYYSISLLSLMTNRLTMHKVPLYLVHLPPLGRHYQRDVYH